MDKIFQNDKALVILGATIVTCICLFTIPAKADTIVTAYLTGMSGLAVGQRMRAGDTTPPK